MRSIILELWFFESFFIFSHFSHFSLKPGIELVEVYLNFEMSQVMTVHPGSTVSLSFQLPTLWEALSVSPSIGLLVCLSVQVEKWKNKLSRCLCVGVGVGVWMGVGCLCLKQRNTCREWNKPKRCLEKKKRQSTRQKTITKNSKTSHLRLFSYGENRLYR